MQVLQWLIVHADTIQSLLRCQELSMGALQELSLLTGIISKTALPGTKMSSHPELKAQSSFNVTSALCEPRVYNQWLSNYLMSQVPLRWVEKSTALRSWSSKVTLTDSRSDDALSFYYIPTCSNFHFYLVQPSLTSASTVQCEICISGNVSLSLFFLAPMSVSARPSGRKWAGQVAKTGWDLCTWRLSRTTRRDGGGHATGLTVIL